MLRLTNLTVPPDADEAAVRAAAAARLGVKPERIASLRIVRKSVDSRDKGDVRFVLTADAALPDEKGLLARLPKGTAEPAPEPKPFVLPKPVMPCRPVVVGAGPAGLFAALTLAQAGTRPILIERGRPVEERAGDVARMRGEGRLDPESNVQFGEGGAGAFSDGKLNTGTKSPYQRHVLETFVRHGAPEEILILQKPHIGTDLLRGVVAAMRQEILRLGGEVRFSTKLTGLILRDGRVEGIRLSGPEGEAELRTDTVLLAIGHSARDTITALHGQGIRMEQKPFAIGVRIEHPQAMISRSQYGRFAGHPALGPAPYKLNVHTPDGRGAYTFCMCPGGEVIAAASEPGRLAVNGMSLHARDGENANAALLVGVRTEDFPGADPLAGIRLQRDIEEKAFRLGGGGYRAPVQLVGDLLAGRASRSLGDVAPTYRPGWELSDLRACLPAFVIDDLKLGITGMDRQLKGFARPDAVLTGVETRSSSPVRIPREAGLMASSAEGLYPVGEGAGYAGGIVSAAVDGIRAALAAMERSPE